MYNVQVHLRPNRGNLLLSLYDISYLHSFTEEVFLLLFPPFLFYFKSRC